MDNLKFVNFWLENDGSYLPTYFRLKGIFDATAIKDHDSIGIFFDNTVKLSFDNDY